MLFQSHRNPISAHRSPGAVKNWVIGWTADEVKSSIQRPQQEINRPGAYGLLVGSSRR
jgi:hypothetical protein